MIESSALFILVYTTILTPLCWISVPVEHTRYPAAESLRLAAWANAAGFAVVILANCRRVDVETWYSVFGSELSMLAMEIK